MEMTKGDNAQFQFQRKTQSGSVITELPTEMYITFKPNSVVTEYLFQKRLSNNTITFNSTTNYYSFEILPADTNSLPYGTYYFDIEIISNGKKSTIYKGELSITEQYTFPENEV